MLPRTTIKSRDRPLSAIYIGSTPSTPASSNVNSVPQTIPDLPEPPSPIGSGLPSPPATNSTGSGSTGDPAGMARRRMVETTQNSQNNSEGSSTRSSSRLSATHDEYDYDFDQDEEQTMRLKIGGGSNESVLERARSLAQRNKLQLDKLAAGKLGRASPSSNSSRTHRHSMPDPSRALSGSETEREGDSLVYSPTSSRENRLSSAPTSPYRNRNQHASGSNYNTTSPARRKKRVSYNDDNNSASDDNHDEQRAPTVNLNSFKKTPLLGARRRSALPHEFREGSIDEESTTKDGLPQTSYRPTTESAAAATSPMLNAGRRPILRGNDDYRSSIQDLPSRAYTTPVPTPNSVTPVSAKSTTNYDNSSPTIHASGSNTIRRQAAARRERGQFLRGGSAESALGGPVGRSLVGEGLRAAGLSRRVGVGTWRDRERTVNTTISELDSNKPRPMRTSDSPDVFTRGGWDPEESPAGRHRRSVFDAPESASSSRTLPPRASTSMADYTSRSHPFRTSMSTVHQHSDSEDDQGGGGEDGDGGEGGVDGETDGRIARARKDAHGALTSREVSLSRREQILLERKRELNRRKREIDRAGSVLGRYHNNTSTSITATPLPSPASVPAPLRDRYLGSFGTGSRQTPGHSHQPSQASNHSHNSNTQSEHAKLLVDSLSMFESQIVKLIPALGTAGTNHADMLTRNAQTLVVNAERLNTMLRVGNGRALDAQIEAEVEGDYAPPHYPSAFGSRDPLLTSLVDIWRKVGADYREGLRVSDDLIRAATGLLLGVGRVMKEYVYLQQSSEIGSTHGGTPRGSPAVHGKRISLGEEDARLGSVSPETRESRRSWEAGTTSSASGGGGAVVGGGSSNASVSTGTGSGGSNSVAAGSREEALRRLAGIRPDSPLARASPAFRAVRELDRLETASPALGTASATGGGMLGLPKVNIPGARRLFAPSQQREMALVNDHYQQSNSDDYYDPSPTPAARISRILSDRILGRGEMGVPVILTQQEYQHTPLQQVHEITPLERSRTLTSSRGEQVYETPLRRNLTLASGHGDGVDDKASPSIIARDHDERRRISIASATSATTIRGVNSTGSNVSSAISSHNPGPSTLSTPSGATTVVTPDDGISDLTSPKLTGMSVGIRVARTESVSSQRGGGLSASASTAMYSTSTKPTFSRPEGVPGLQQQLDGYRKRAAAVNTAVEMDGSVSGDGSANGSTSGKGRISMMTHESKRDGEREREMTRKTMGVVSGSSTSMPSRNGVKVSVGGSSDVGGGEAGEFGEMEPRDVGSATISTGITGNGNGRRPVDLTMNAVSRNAASRNAAVTVGGVARRERRAVADIWPKSRG